jgi:hypothetical protein
LHKTDDGHTGRLAQDQLTSSQVFKDLPMLEEFLAVLIQADGAGALDPYIEKCKFEFPLDQSNPFPFFFDRLCLPFSVVPLCLLL